MAFASRTYYPRNGILLVALLLVTVIFISSSSLAAAENSNSTYRGSSGQHCSGSIGACQGDETEWLMESGTSRSLLQGNGGKITYNAVNNGNSPASGNAASGNSYSRGCSGAYRCNNGNY